MPNFDVVVIGAGVAGMTAALNAKRLGKSVIVLEKSNYGGQIALTSKVENIPSIKSINGQEFTDNMFDQIMDLGVEFELEEVISIKKDGDVFITKTDYNEYISKTVINASGCEHRHIGVDKEEQLVGHGISYCALCDGAFYEGQEVVLIGDANTAMQYAMQLANKCSKVHICALFDHLFADKIVVDKVLTIPNIDVRFNLSLKEFLGDKDLEGLVFEDTKTKELVKYNVNGCFIAIGQVPNNDIFKDLVDLDKGYVVVNDFMETKTPGLYAAGDCRKKTYRQVITAQNDGAIAAFRACEYCNLRA